MGAIAAMALVLGACAPTYGSHPTPPGSTAWVNVGGQTVTVSVPTGLTVTASSSSAASLPAVPQGQTFPFGALKIDVAGVTPGAVAHVTITTPTAVDGVQKTIGGVWDSFFDDGTTGYTLSADHKTLELVMQDGGRGDNDGVANGVIDDDAAPATGPGKGCYQFYERGLMGPGMPLKYTGPLGGAGAYKNASVYWDPTNKCVESSFYQAGTVVQATSEADAYAQCAVVDPLTTYVRNVLGSVLEGIAYFYMPANIWYCYHSPSVLSTDLLVPGTCYSVPSIVGRSFRYLGPKNTPGNALRFQFSSDCTGQISTLYFLIQAGSETNAQQLCPTFSVDNPKPSALPDDTWLCANS